MHIRRSLHSSVVTIGIVRPLGRLPTLDRMIGPFGTPLSSWDKLTEIPPAPFEIIRLDSTPAFSLPPRSDTDVIAEFGKNSRKPKKANHGKRPVSSVRRKKRARTKFGRHKVKYPKTNTHGGTL